MDAPRSAVANLLRDIFLPIIALVVAAAIGFAMVFAVYWILRP